MAEAATKTDEPAPEAEVIRKEHDVSIVLSFMNDEHEKAAIEVRTRVCLRRTRRGMWVGIIKRPGTNTVALSQSSSLDLGRGAKRGLTLWKKPNLHFPPSATVSHAFLHPPPQKTPPGSLPRLRQAHPVQGRGAAHKEGVRFSVPFVRESHGWGLSRRGWYVSRVSQIPPPRFISNAGDC